MGLPVRLSHTLCCQHAWRLPASHSAQSPTIFWHACHYDTLKSSQGDETPLIIM